MQQSSAAAHTNELSGRLLNGRNERSSFFYNLAYYLFAWQNWFRSRTLLFSNDHSGISQLGLCVTLGS